MADGVVSGRATFKAVRGEYGAGKTFFARWLAEQAKRRGMATAEVQISETETPLHKLETVYRRLVEQLSTAAYPPSALREVIDAWFYTLEEDVLAEGVIAQDDAQALTKAVDELLELRLAAVARTTPALLLRCGPTGRRPATVTRPPRRRCSPGSAVSPTSRPPPAAPPA
jgi:type II secretory pathway predicted ATPase ExeA